MKPTEVAEALKALRRQFLTKRTARLPVMNALLEGEITFGDDDIPSTQVPGALDMVLEWLRSNDLECMDRGVSQMDPKWVERFARELEARAGQKLRWGPRITAQLL